MHAAFGQETKPIRDVSNAFGGVLLSPTSRRVSVRPTQKGTLSFTVAVPGLNAATARLEILSFLPKDWTYKTDYGVTHERDAASWIAERDSMVSLAAGERKQVKLNYTVPARASGSYWAMLHFSPRIVGSTTRMKVAIDALILFNVGRPTRPSVKISSPFLAPSTFGNSSSLLATLPVENTGTSAVIIGATGTVKNLFTNRTVAELGPQRNDLLPGTKRHLAFNAPALVDGRYRIDFRAEMVGRRLPPVSSEWVVKDGVPTQASEATSLELPPLVVDPPALSFAIPAGAARSQVIRVINLSDNPMTVDLSARTLEQSPSGSIGVSEDASPLELGVRLSPSVLALRPRSSNVIRVTVQPTRETTGNRWFGISIAQRDNPKVLPETVNASITVAGTTSPKLEIENTAVEFSGLHPTLLRFTVRNTGNVALQLDPNAAVLEAGVRVVARLTVSQSANSGILPGVALPFTAQMPPDLKPGNYIVEVAYQYGKDLYARQRVAITVLAPAKSSDLKKPVTVTSGGGAGKIPKTPGVKK